VGNEHGFIRGLFLLALLAAGAWFIATRWWPAHNYRRFSADLETAVNRQLFEARVYDHQILSHVNREQSRFGLVWIESTMRIQAASGSQLAEIRRRLASLARRSHCQYDEHPAPGGTEAEIHQLFFVLQRFTLLEPVAAPSATTVTPAAPAAVNGPSVAIVVDDVAYDMTAMDRFASLGVPLTFAILPRDRRTKALAEKATQLRFPIILHLPMEPIDVVHNDPGGAALRLRMTPEELHRQFEKDVTSVPNIVGINNHMGSAFTENADKMRLVLRWVKERHLFFLDSRTSLHSVVPRVAREVGVPCRVNEAFLDNSDTVESIEQQLDQVMRMAIKHHYAIAIGHYRRKHLVEALARKIPEFEARGVTFVGLPSLYPPK